MVVVGLVVGAGLYVAFRRLRRSRSDVLAYHGIGTPRVLPPSHGGESG